jgi:PD-(D/E)XK nuclease superfamily protein
MTLEQDGIQIKQEGSKVNIIMDMSMFDLFELCAARYDYRHNHNKSVPISQKSKALDGGGLLHEGFEVYYKLLKEGKTHFNDRIHAAVKRIQLVSSDPEVSNSEPEEVNEIISGLEQSCEFFRYEDEHLIIHEVEQAFAYVLFEDEFIRIIITGKIDLLVDKPAIGRDTGYTNLPIDHKSNRRDFETPRLSNQFMNYASAVGSNYLIVNKVGLQTSLKPEEKFKRIPLSYDPVILNDWKQNVTKVIMHHYLTCIAQGYWPTNFTSCFKFNRKCEYYEVCDSSGQEARLFKLESDFVTVSPWDVTARLVKKGQ